MKSQYCEFTEEQAEAYRKRLHSMIHWLLIYREEQNPVLPEYFEMVQGKLAGLNSLLMNPPEIIELMGLIECAKLEYQKGENCDTKVYRKTVLDAHGVIDRIGNTKEG